MKVLAVFATLVAGLSSIGCSSGALTKRCAELAEQREDLARRNAALEGQLASAQDAEAILRRDLEEANQRNNLKPGPDITIPEGLQGRGVRVRSRGGDSVIELPSEVFFASGSTKLTDGGEKALAEVTKALKDAGKDSFIRVEGHSDSDPLHRHKDKYHCNWDLSFERAHAVLHYLLDKGGFDPRRMAADVYGEFQPQDSSNKAKNRRVEIVVSRAPEAEVKAPAETEKKVSSRSSVHGKKR